MDPWIPGWIPGSLDGSLDPWMDPWIPGRWGLLSGIRNPGLLPCHEVLDKRWAFRLSAFPSRADGEKNGGDMSFL